MSLVRVATCVIVLAFGAIGAWVALPKREPSLPRQRLGSPKKFSDTVVKEMKSAAKIEVTKKAEESTQDSGNVEKLKAVQSNLASMITIMKGWDTKAKQIPLDITWPADLLKRLNMTRGMKPEWRTEELKDLEKKLAKTNRRINIPKTASAADGETGNTHEGKWKERYRRMEIDLQEMIKIMRTWNPEGSIPSSPDYKPPTGGSTKDSVVDRLEFIRKMKPADRKQVLADNVKKLGKVKAWLQV